MKLFRVVQIVSDASAIVRQLSRRDLSVSGLTIASLEVRLQSLDKNDSRDEQNKILNVSAHFKAFDFSNTQSHIIVFFNVFFLFTFSSFVMVSVCQCEI